MEPMASGRAAIRHATTNELYYVAPDDLEWEIVEIDEKGMGRIVHHEATIEHSELGELSWDLWEYPIGVVDHQDQRIGSHELVENFQFHFIDTPYVQLEPFSNTEFATLSTYQKKRYLIDWFHHYYWDPANDLPYNSREGGYQWIYGGPYEALEVLSDEFGSDVEHELIELAVDEIQSDGLMDWSPSPNHPAQEREHDEENYDEWLIQSVANLPTETIITVNNLEAEREKRDKIVSVTRKILAEFGARDDHRHKIGGNNPPDEFRLTSEEWDGILGGVTRLHDGLTEGNANPIEAAETLLSLQVFWDGLKRRAGLFFDELVKSAGKATGEWIGPKGVFYGSAVLSMIGGKLSALFSAAAEWLQTFNLPF